MRGMEATSTRTSKNKPKTPVRGRAVDGEAIQRECFVRGLSQRALAEKAGVSTATANKAFGGGVLDPSSFQKIVSAILATPEDAERSKFVKEVA